MINASLKVFSELFVGTKPQGEGEKLGFMAPHEMNAAGRKRQTTIRNWMRSYPWPVPLDDISANELILKNEPISGFKITDDVKRVYYGGGNVVFRVQDPRGFELEIQSQNLMTIINVAGLLKGGEIPGKCVWGRDGAQNILVHETSEEFKNAQHAAETIKPLTGIAKSSYKPGDTVQLTNGDTVTYLGRFWFTSVQERPTLSGVTLNTPEGYELIQSEFALTQPEQFYVVQLPNDFIRVYKDLKVSAVVEQDLKGLDVDDALAIVNAACRRCNVNFASSAYHAKLRFASANKEYRPKFVVTELSAEELQNVTERFSRKKVDPTVWASGAIVYPYLFMLNDKLMHFSQYAVNSDYQRMRYSGVHAPDQYSWFGQLNVQAVATPYFPCEARITADSRAVVSIQPQVSIHDFNVRDLQLDDVITTTPNVFTLETVVFTGDNVTDWFLELHKAGKIRKFSIE